MTEKEMIEEMAKIMCGNDCEECAKETAEWRGCSLAKAKAEECLIKKEAKLLYEKGYRKIPEGLVVLSKEEWARLRNLEINYDDVYEAYIKYDIENKQLKKELQELEEQRDRQAYIAEELVQEKHRWTEQARKETAKEIIEMFSDKNYITEQDLINAIAKKYGVKNENNT